MIHLYCGAPKGKTTAAMGLALRAAGHGERVVIAQFLKSGNSGERKILAALPNVTLMPVPDAMPDDGVLDVLAVGEISRLTFFRLVGKYAQGLYRQYPQLITDWHGQSLSFSSPREITVVVDGEVMRGTRFTVRLSPLKINFFFPAGADYSPEF